MHKSPRSYVQIAEVGSLAGPSLSHLYMPVVLCCHRGWDGLSSLLRHANQSVHPSVHMHLQAATRGSAARKEEKKQEEAATAVQARDQI